MSHCPNCKLKYVCPCDFCKKNNPVRQPWIERDKTNDSSIITCPQCGLTKDAHEWMDIFWEQYYKEKKK